MDILRVTGIDISELDGRCRDSLLARLCRSKDELAGMERYKSHRRHGILYCLVSVMSICHCFRARDTKYS